MKKIVLGMMLATAVTFSVYAGDNMGNGDSKDMKNMTDMKAPITNQGVEEPYFRANEWSADLFGTYSDGISRSDSSAKYERSGFGGGLGGNYFFTKYVGFGVEGYGWDSTHGGTGAVSGNFILRYPIESWHLAPYALIGGGYEFADIGTWDGNFGLGVEYRFTKNWGVFADGRYVLVDNSTVNNDEVARLGVRYAF